MENKHSLPEILFRAISNDPYSKGDADFSTTELIAMPQQIALIRRHKDKIKEDASERLWSFLGQTVHVILERAAIPGAIVEERFFSTINGARISGQVDVILNGTLGDYKLTSVYAYIYGSRIPEWQAQANINRWLAHKNGIEVDRAENYLILRDWQSSKAGSGSYPAIPFVTVPLKLWSLEEAEEYVLERVKLHQAAQNMEDGYLRPCTDEERWMRAGKPIRCISYCAVGGTSGICLQQAAYRE